MEQFSPSRFESTAVLEQTQERPFVDERHKADLELVENYQAGRLPERLELTGPYFEPDLDETTFIKEGDRFIAVGGGEMHGNIADLFARDERELELHVEAEEVDGIFHIGDAWATLYPAEPEIVETAAVQEAAEEAEPSYRQPFLIIDTLAADEDIVSVTTETAYDAADPTVECAYHKRHFIKKAVREGRPLQDRVIISRSDGDYRVTTEYVPQEGAVLAYSIAERIGDEEEEEMASVFSTAYRVNDAGRIVRIEANGEEVEELPEPGSEASYAKKADYIMRVLDGEGPLVHRSAGENSGDGFWISETTYELAEDGTVIGYTTIRYLSDEEFLAEIEADPELMEGVMRSDSANSEAFDPEHLLALLQQRLEEKEEGVEGEPEQEEPLHAVIPEPAMPGREVHHPQGREGAGEALPAFARLRVVAPGERTERRVVRQLSTRRVDVRPEGGGSGELRPHLAVQAVLERPPAFAAAFSGESRPRLAVYEEVPVPVSSSAKAEAVHPPTRVGGEQVLAVSGSVAAPRYARVAPASLDGRLLSFAIPEPVRQPERRKGSGGSEPTPGPQPASLHVFLRPDDGEHLPADPPERPASSLRLEIPVGAIFEGSPEVAQEVRTEGTVTTWHTEEYVAEAARLMEMGMGKEGALAAQEPEAVSTFFTSSSQAAEETERPAASRGSIPVRVERSVSQIYATRREERSAGRARSGSSASVSQPSTAAASDQDDVAAPVAQRTASSAAAQSAVADAAQAPVAGPVRRFRVTSQEQTQQLAQRIDATQRQRVGSLMMFGMDQLPSSADWRQAQQTAERLIADMGLSVPELAKASIGVVSHGRNEFAIEVSVNGRREEYPLQLSRQYAAAA